MPSRGTVQKSTFLSTKAVLAFTHVSMSRPKKSKRCILVLMVTSQLLKRFKQADKETCLQFAHFAIQFLPLFASCRRTSGPSCPHKYSMVMSSSYPFLGNNEKGHQRGGVNLCADILVRWNLEDGQDAHSEVLANLSYPVV